MVPMEVLGVQIEASSGLPLVLLREVEDPHRVLPISVGHAEAVAIAIGLKGVEVERPLTHDLLAELLESTRTDLTEAVVTDLRDGTYYAELHLRAPGGDKTVSSRPSDAIALAVRVSAPLYADEDVLADNAVHVVVSDADEEGEAVDAEEVVDEFRSFLESIDPEDFAEEGPAGPPEEES